MRENVGVGRLRHLVGGTLADVVIETPTLIVGAGPSGLAVAGRLRRAGADFEMVDAAEQIASSWHAHYDRLHLHTVKEHSHLPHMPFPSSYPRYVPRRMLADYYARYAEAFGIRPRFGVRVQRIERSGDGWLTTTEGPDTFRSSSVVVATGVNRVPNRPTLAGEEQFSGWVVHSRDYRNPSPHLGHRVLVVGMGNTGAEIALDLSEHEVDVSISARGPVNIIPRDVLGRPTQVTALMLSRLPERVGDRIGVMTRNLTIRDLSAFGVETPKLAPAAQLRRHGQTPVMDIGTVARIKSGEIGVRPGIDHLTEDSVAFTDGTVECFDDIILATGYRPQLADFFPDCEDLLTEEGTPVAVIAGGHHAGLFFVGFDNHRPGGILGTVLDESEQVATAIVG